MLTKLYTTGQMIDMLDTGEKAETKNGKYQATKTEHGMIVIKNEHGNVGLNEIVLGSMWRIQPKYVSFEDAMNALNGGKDVVLYLFEDGKPEKTLFRQWFHLDTREGITFKDMFDGKWVIQD